jgi:hypothetical protein
MDLSRQPLVHLTFGNGPHYCLGAGLTRLVMTETLPRLFTRFPGLALTSREPVLRSSTSFAELFDQPGPRLLGHLQCCVYQHGRQDIVKV